MPEDITPGEALFSARGITAGYGKIIVVRDVSLEVGAGEVRALLGPNGAGKTSLVEHLAGRVAGSGEIRLGTQRLDGLPSHRRARAGLALVPTGRGLFPPLSVADNLALGARLADPGRRHELRARVFEMFPILSERLTQRAGMMSGGEQQMLAVAKALMGDPRVLILDEPTQGLAPAVLDILVEAIEVTSRIGLAVLLVEQNHAFAARVAHHVTVLTDGTVTRHGDIGSFADQDELFATYMEG